MGPRRDVSANGLLAEENEYEAERLKRIAENKALLDQLGLSGL